MSYYKVNLPDEVSKIMLIRDKILKSREGQSIVYVRTITSARMLHKALVEYGYTVTAIQGVSVQEDRDKMMKQFEDGLTQVLISIDAFARGFDHSRVNLIVNYDLPRLKLNPTQPHNVIYSHRIRDKGTYVLPTPFFIVLFHIYDLYIPIECNIGLDFCNAEFYITSLYLMIYIYIDINMQYL